MFLIKSKLKRKQLPWSYFAFIKRNTREEREGDAPQSLSPKFTKLFQTSFHPQTPRIGHSKFYPGLLKKWLGLHTFEVRSPNGP